MNNIKNVTVRIAGQNTFVPIEVPESMTANQAKEAAGCPLDYDLSPAVGEPPFGSDELIYSRIKDGGKVIASPAADAGK